MQSDSDSESEFFDAADTQFDNSWENADKAQDSKRGPRRQSSTSEDEKSKGNVKTSRKTKHEKRSSSIGESSAAIGITEQTDKVSELDPALEKLEITEKSLPSESQGPNSPKTGESPKENDNRNNKAAAVVVSSDLAPLLASGVSETPREGIPEGGGGTAPPTEEDTPPPVAPPRRKRKKKLAAAASSEAVDKTDGPAKTSSEPSSPEATSTPIKTQSISDTAPQESQKDFETSSFPDNDKPPDQTDITTADLSSLIDNVEDDPSIHLDYRSQEMKEVLAKASSTEVIPALTLDCRLKSHSITSLGSSGNRSDSFMSVASNASNGPTLKKSGSLVSVGSIHLHQQGSSEAGHGQMVRVRSVSGRPLSDMEILEQVQVKNLDTGESIPLSVAEERLPKCTNPLALHIMRLTSEYHSNPELANIDQEDGPDVARKVKKKTKKLKKFLGRTVNKMKAEKKIKEGKESKEAVRSEESSSSDEESTSQDTPSMPYIKIKSAHRKGPAEFEKLKLLQDLSGEHVGAVWTIKFSVCGRLMATAGQDHMVRVWVLKESEEAFEEMRTKYSRPSGSSSSQANSEEELVLSEKDEDDAKEKDKDDEGAEGKSEEGDKAKEKKEEEEDLGPFNKTPFCTYFGHTGDVLDLSWSKNYFLLSSSMDKTVRLWHISRTECLCCFQHIDFVTAIVFHPRDDRYFLSGSLDGKIRLWNIPDKKVALWNEVEGAGSNLITAANFCLQGRFAVIGTYDGRCIFYETERLKYHTQWQVRTSRNKRARGRKISGIEPMPGEEKVLITSNDSRIRLYDLKDNSLYCKYKGCSNTSSQIKASFSHDGQYLICGSEDHFVYIWRTQHGIPSSRRDKNEFYESFSAHDAVVTAAVFAPVPWLVVEPDPSGNPVSSEVLVTADWGGAIKLFVNR